MADERVAVLDVMHCFQWLLADPIRPNLVSLKALCQFKSPVNFKGWFHLLQHPFYGIQYIVFPSDRVNRVVLPAVLDVIAPRLRAQESVARSSKSCWSILLVKGPKYGALGDGIDRHPPSSLRQHHDGTIGRYANLSCSSSRNSLMGRSPRLLHRPSRNFSNHFCKEGEPEKPPIRMTLCVPPCKHKFNDLKEWETNIDIVTIVACRDYLVLQDVSNLHKKPEKHCFNILPVNRQLKITLD